MNSFRIGGVIFFLFSLAYGWVATDIPLDFWSQQEAFNARTLPLILAACGVLASLAAILQPGQTSWRLPDNLKWKPVASLLLLMSGYGLSLDYLGFLPATCLLLGIGFYLLGERRPGYLLMMTVPFVLGFWLLMDALGIYLGSGTVWGIFWGMSSDIVRGESIWGANGWHLLLPGESHV